MITRKPSALETAQLVCAALVIAGLVMILPLGWVFLIVGLAGLGIAVGFEVVKVRNPPPAPAPAAHSEGD
jgi:4-hydroxybenzoate polyprenyltransferase